MRTFLCGIFSLLVAVQWTESNPAPDPLDTINNNLNMEEEPGKKHEPTGRDHSDPKMGRPKCPKCSSGNPTSCTCPNGTTVDNPKNTACGIRVFPSDKRVWPTSCTCEDGEVLDIPEGYPEGCKCPKCSSGRPVSCTCPDGSTVDGSDGSTVDKPKKGACGKHVFPTSCTCEDGEVLDFPEGGCGGRG